MDNTDEIQCGSSARDEANLTLEFYLQELQEALNQGWMKLKGSDSYKIYTEAFQYFKKMGLYEGLFRPQIPNPVYDNAAKELGQVFLQKTIDFGLYFAELFPGNFSISTEEIIGNAECRIFYLTTYYHKKKLGTYKLIFEHCHDYFDFPTPPTLQIVY